MNVDKPLAYSLAPPKILPEITPMLSLFVLLIELSLVFELEGISDELRVCMCVSVRHTLYL